jgi:hypothetical protein
MKHGVMTCIFTTVDTALEASWTFFGSRLPQTKTSSHTDVAKNVAFQPCQVIPPKFKKNYFE